MWSPRHGKRDRHGDGIPAFNLIKHPGMRGDEVDEAITSFAASLMAVVRERDGFVAGDMFDSGYDPRTQVGSFIHKLLGRVCSRSHALTVVVEPQHMDDTYRDLTASTYSREFFDAGKWALRLSLFSEVLNADEYFLRPGRMEYWESVQPRKNVDGEAYPSLQDIFIGSVVIEPRAGGVIGKTLLDPAWVANEDVCARLSDFDLTIRGKRLSVQAFPWREQDSDVLSCAETTALSIASYYANEYNDYPRALPTQMLESIERRIDGHVTQTQGLDFVELTSLLTSVGFRTRRYDIARMSSDAVPGEATGPEQRLWKVARAYIDSGIPFAVNVQPEEEGIGHSLVAVGLAADTGNTSWDTQQDLAVRIEGPRRQDGTSTTLEIIDVADLEQNRRVCVIDDRQMPYSCQSWDMPSAFIGMEPTEILVPNALQMSIGALDARDIAGEVLRSPKHGLAASTEGFFSDSERIVLTQQMVSVRSYLRYRVATCDPSISIVWESCPFPRYGWLFECIRLSDWKQSSDEHCRRMACAELFVDCTASAAGEPISHVVLLRYPGLLHYHGPDGEGVTFKEGVFPLFPAYNRNLRRVHIHRLDRGE